VYVARRHSTILSPSSWMVYGWSNSYRKGRCAGACVRPDAG
jgi:hypothetical protein